MGLLRMVRQAPLNSIKLNAVNENSIKVQYFTRPVACTEIIVAQQRDERECYLDNIIR